MTENTASNPSAPNSKPPATDIGAILKQARLRRGQSFEVVFQHTRIPKKFLEAIEANRFDEFPAPVYLQGFLKSYCEHLDVEFEPLWNQLHPSPPKAEPVMEARAPEPAATPLPKPARPNAQAMPATLPVAAAVAALAAVVIVAIYWAVPKSPSRPTTPPPLARPHIAEPLPPVVTPPKKMTLEMNFRNEAWMSLRCDGKLRFEGRGPAGFAQAWTAMKEFAIRTSNPEDLSLKLDGKELKLSPEMKNPSGEYLVKRI